MASQPKRPGLPAPDPNWELELHPERASRKPSPDSRDEMLAHALLRAEPDPVPGKPDEFGDPESRRTLPPPGAISDHVARMMAEAAELDDSLSGFEQERDTMEFFNPSPEALSSFDSAPQRPPARSHAAPSHAGAKGAPNAGAQKAKPQAATSASALASRDTFPEITEREPLAEHDDELHFARSDPTPSFANLADLPAVFALDAAWGSDDLLSGPITSPDRPTAPGAPRSLPRFSSSDPAISIPFLPLSDPVISASPEVSTTSGPALSPPFASLDPQELADELEQAQAPDSKRAAIEARYSAGDYGRALVLAEAALDSHPGDAAVVRYAESCRHMLYERYLERLGAADSVPQLLMQRSDLTGLALDHRAGFLLSCVDGTSTIEEIIDVSAMAKLDAVRILYELVQEGVIEMASPR